MKRVLYIWQAGYPWDVRVEKICTTLQDAGFEVILLARWKPEQSQEEVINGMTVIRVGYQLPTIASTPISHNPVWQKAINSAIDMFRPHIVMPREILLAQAAAKAAQKHGIPVVMDMAEHYPAIMRSWKKYKKNWFIKHLVHNIQIPDAIEKSSVQLMDGILTVCNESSARIAAQYLYPLHNLQVVKNTPTLQAYNSTPRSFSQSKFIQFAHHGFMTPPRNLELFVEGFSQALPYVPNIRLALAGTGESDYDITQSIRLYRVQKYVILSGAYQHKDLPSLYHQTDIGILPYKQDPHINTTIPNKLFDYMAFGIPVLVSEAKPMKRIVEETGAGIAVDCSTPQSIAHGIQTMLQQDIAQMSINGIRAFREKYNWQEDTKALLKFLEAYV